MSGLLKGWTSCLFVWFDSFRPINNLSVIKGQVFLGRTSTKLELMFLLKDTTQWRRWGSNPVGLVAKRVSQKTDQSKNRILKYLENSKFMTESRPLVFVQCHVFLTSVWFFSHNDYGMLGRHQYDNWAVAWDFQQCGILTCVDSDEPLQPPLKLTYSKWCSASSLTIMEYSSEWQRFWSDCAYAQADLRLCRSHIPLCWKSHALAQL